MRTKEETKIAKSETENIYNKKNLFKKKLKIKTELDEENEFDEIKTEETNIKNVLFTQNEKNIDQLLLLKEGLPLKIKIFKCVIYKNTDPNLNEEMVKDLIHKRNKSQGLNGSFILKLPKGIDIDEKKEERNDNEKRNSMKKKMKKFRGSISGSFFN